jgi:hypothetical protein
VTFLNYCLRTTVARGYPFTSATRVCFPEHFVTSHYYLSGQTDFANEFLDSPAPDK